MTLAVYLDRYKAKLFPLRKAERAGDENSKRPLVKDWPKADFKRDELEGFARDGYGLGWSLGPTDLVVDVDTKKGKPGLDSLAKLEKLLGGSLESVAPEVTNDSGSRHYYLTLPAGTEIRKTLDEFPGIDFLSAGCYVVAVGSPHWKGGLYRWGEWTEILEKFDRKEAPKLLVDLIRRDKKSETAEAPARPIELETVKEALDALDPKEFRAYDDWRKLLFAVHSATGGSVEGLDAFKSWSVADPLYREAGESIANIWEKADSKRAGGVSGASLFQALRDHGQADLAATLQAQAVFDEIPVEESGKDEKPEKGLKKIVKSPREFRINNAILEELPKAKGLFQKNGSLVSISDGGRAALSPVALVEILSEVVDLGYWEKRDKGRIWRSILIPIRTGQQILARGSWFGVPTLRMVSEIPVFTSDGILQKPGYDSRSGVFYRKTLEIGPLDPAPTKAKAVEALRRLCGVVSDFPFETPASRSVWLAGLLAVLGRPAIAGPVPLFLIVGNQSGIGKSLLYQALATIVEGSSGQSQKLADNPEEMAKQIFSSLLAAPGTLCFDNLTNGSDFGSPALDSVLTSKRFAGRVLGESRIAEVEVETVFFSTGNRIGISKESDSFRRLALCSLCYPEENPKARTGFKHGADSDFLRWVRDNREQFIADGLTILAAARAAEEDLPKVEPWGSYSDFSRVVRRALVWLGEPDPIETQKAAEALNEDGDEVAAVIDGLRTFFGDRKFSAGGMVEALRSVLEGLDVSEDNRAIAQAALDALAPAWLKNPAMAAAKRLRSRLRDRPWGGFWIRSEKDPHLKQFVYGVERIRGPLTVEDPEPDDSAVFS